MGAPALISGPEEMAGNGEGIAGNGEKMAGNGEKMAGNVKRWQEMVKRWQEIVKRWQEMGAREEDGERWEKMAHCMCVAITQQLTEEHSFVEKPALSCSASMQEAGRNGLIYLKSH